MVQTHGAPSEKQGKDSVHMYRKPFLTKLIKLLLCCLLHGTDLFAGGEKKASAISSFMQSTKALLYNMYQRSAYGGADPRPVYSDTEVVL